MPIETLIIHNTPPGKTISHFHGWPAAFQDDSRFSTTLLNLSRSRSLPIIGPQRSGRILKKLKPYWDPYLVQSRDWGLVILLHSAVDTGWGYLDVLRPSLQRISSPIAAFFNETASRVEWKLDFLRQIETDLVVFPSHQKRILDMVRRRLGGSVSKVTGIIHTGLDEETYTREKPLKERPLDVGYRSAPYPPWVGNDEHEYLVKRFREVGESHGLSVDLSLDPEDRFPPEEYANFLNQCRAVIGNEVGTDYFDLTDQKKRDAELYLEENPDATRAEVIHHVTKDREKTPARGISGRNIDAAGTGTVQILFRGEYSGYLKPDVHYIPLERDFSNIDVVLKKLNDDAFCEEITQKAYDLVLRELTYDTLLEEFYGEITEFL